MKKKALIFILLVLIAVIGFNMLYNGFSNIDSIAIQKFDEPFKDGKTITEKGKIADIKGILNRANHISSTFTSYKLAGKPLYKIQLKYDDKTFEQLDILENFDSNTTLLISSKGDYYKINEKETKKILDLYVK